MGKNVNEMISYFKKEKLIVEECKQLAKFYLEFEPPNKTPIKNVEILSNYFDEINQNYSAFPAYKYRADLIELKLKRKTFFKYIFFNILVFFLIAPLNSLVQKYVVESDYSPKIKCEKLWLVQMQLALFWRKLQFEH